MPLTILQGFWKLLLRWTVPLLSARRDGSDFKSCLIAGQALDSLPHA